MLKSKTTPEVGQPLHVYCESETKWSRQRNYLHLLNFNEKPRGKSKCREAACKGKTEQSKWLTMVSGLWGWDLKEIEMFHE